MSLEKFGTNTIHTNSLLGLDEYSLQHIFSYLDPFEQYCIAKSHDHFGAIIWHMWNRDLKYVEVDMDILHSDAAEFMEAFQPHVKHLKIKDITMEFLQKISNYNFPKVCHLDFNAYREMDEYFHRNICGENIMTMVQMFPNIKVLKLSNCFVRGKCLQYFHSLEQLSLVDCFEIDQESLQDVLTKRKLSKLNIMDSCTYSPKNVAFVALCPTLQNVKLNEYHLDFDETAYKIMSLPHLSKISVKIYEWHCAVLYGIIERRLRKIVQLRYSGPMNNVPLCLQHISIIDELEELVLQSFDYPIEDISLLHMSLKLQNLSRLHVPNCEFESEVGLLDVISNCQKLVLLDISYTNLDESFICKAIVILKQQTKRTEPIEIWICGTQVNRQLLEEMPNIYSHKLLKINSTSILKQFSHIVLKLQLGDFL